MKNSPDRNTITLSLFEKSVQTFIDTSKTIFEEAKENFITAKYLEKYLWINQYINSKQIFHLNELFDYLSEMKDICGDRDKKLPDKKTIGRYLYSLFKLQLLDHKAVPSNFPNMYKVYWLPTIDTKHKEAVLRTYFESYKEPKSKGKKKLSREEEILTDIQSKLDHYTSESVAEKILAPLKQKKKEEKNTQSAKNQRDYLEKQQKEIPTPATDKIFAQALTQEKKRKAKVIVKNTLAQQQREQTPEERIAQTEVILDELEKIGINITREQLLTIEKREEKILLAEQNRKNNFRITDDSFIDPDNTFVEFSEEIVEEES